MSVDYIKLQKHLTAADDLIKQSITSMSGYYLQSYQHAEENTEKDTLQHKVCQLCSTPFQPCNTKVHILSKKRRQNLALNVHSSSPVILLTCELCNHRNVVECNKPIVDKSKSAKKKISPVTNSSLDEASKDIDETHNKSISFIKEKLSKSINSPILESTPSTKKRKKKSFLTPVQDKKPKESPSLLSFLSSL